MLSTPEKPFYVYVYRDVRPGKEGQPIYVGKGTDRRAKRHLANAENIILYRTIQKIRDVGLEPEIEIVSRFEDETEAFDYERALISSIGRRDLNSGPLANLTDGGEGGSGCIQTPESNQLRREASKLIWEDPELRIRMRSGIDILLQSDEYKKSKAAETGSKWANTAHAEMRKAKMKEAAARPERRAALIKMLADPELRARSASANRANNLKRWKWEVDGIVYPSLPAAAEANGVCESAIRWRIKNGRGRKIRQS